MSEEAEGAYAGIRVLDLSHVIAGPMCTKLMADHGADVIKVEPPAGEMVRRFPFPYAPGMTTQFAQYNSGKRSITVDLTTARGTELILELAARADVFVENFRPGVLARLGLGVDALRAVNPRLVVCSISTFGQDNALSSLPGFGYIAEAHSGLMALASDEHDPPGSFGTALSDMVVAVHAFGAIGAALFRALRTGEGTHVDVASYETMVATIDHALVVHSWSKGAQRFGGYRRRHPAIVPNGTAVAGDGRAVVYGITTDSQFAALLDLMERPDLHDDPRFTTLAARGRNPDAVYDLIEAWALTVPDAEELVTMLRAIKVPSTRVRDYGEVAEDPHLRERGVLASVDLGLADPVLIPVAPHHLSGARVAVDGPPPRLGQHTREVLAAELSMSDADIDALIGAGVVHDQEEQA